MKNRRNFLRFDVPLNLVFRPLRENIPYSFGTTRNFSRKGFCFVSEDFIISAEKVLEFKVEIPDADTFINGLGEFMWDKRIGGVSLIGLKLRDMHKESQWEILDYCYNQWLEQKQGRRDLCHKY